MDIRPVPLQDGYCYGFIYPVVRNGDFAAGYIEPWNTPPSSTAKFEVVPGGYDGADYSGTVRDLGLEQQFIFDDTAHVPFIHQEIVTVPGATYDFDIRYRFQDVGYAQDTITGECTLYLYDATTGSNILIRKEVAMTGWRLIGFQYQIPSGQCTTKLSIVAFCSYYPDQPRDLSIDNVRATCISNPCLSRPRQYDGEFCPTALDMTPAMQPNADFSSGYIEPWVNNMDMAYGGGAPVRLLDPNSPNNPFTEVWARGHAIQVSTPPGRWAHLSYYLPLRYGDQYTVRLIYFFDRASVDCALELWTGSLDNSANRLFNTTGVNGWIATSSRHYFDFPAKTDCSTDGLTPITLRLSCSNPQESPMPPTLSLRIT